MQYEYIQFRYKLNDGILPLVRDTVVGFEADFIIGYMNKAFVSRLEHCSLYMVCEYCDDGTLRNPIGIVATNENAAIEAFISITGKTNGTIQCELENRCNKIKVLPTGKVVKA